MKRLRSGSAANSQSRPPADLQSHGPNGGIRQFAIGSADLTHQQGDQALVWLRQADAASPDTPSILAPLVSVLALTGHDEEARATLARYLANKRTHARTIAQWQGSADPNTGFERFAKRFKSGLRQAGMAEG